MNTANKPSPPFLLKLPAPTLANEGVVLVMDPRSSKGHYVCCGACAATQGMSLSTYIQKHHVNAGAKCKPGFDSLPEGALFLPLDEIQGWRTYSDSSADQQGELTVDELNVEELNVEQLNVASRANEADVGEHSEVDDGSAVGGGVALGDDYVKSKLSHCSKKKLSWLAGLKGRFSGKGTEELVDLALEEYRKKPFELE